MDQSQRRELARSVHQSSGSFELVLGAVLFALIGLLVDRAVGITPVLTITFAVMGFAGATIRIWAGYKLQMQAHEEARS